MLAEQRERELAARNALVRARQVAAVCIVLAIGAIVAAVFAYWSTQRAKRAERLAQQSRVQAEQTARLPHGRTSRASSKAPAGSM